LHCQTQATKSKIWFDGGCVILPAFRIAQKAKPATPGYMPKQLAHSSSKARNAVHSVFILSHITISVYLTRSSRIVGIGIDLFTRKHCRQHRIPHDHSSLCSDANWGDLSFLEFSQIRSIDSIPSSWSGYFFNLFSFREESQSKANHRVLRAVSQGCEMGLIELWGQSRSLDRLTSLSFGKKSKARSICDIHASIELWGQSRSLIRFVSFNWPRPEYLLSSIYPHFPCILSLFITQSGCEVLCHWLGRISRDSIVFGIHSDIVFGNSISIMIPSDTSFLIPRQWWLISKTTAILPRNQLPLIETRTNIRNQYPKPKQSYDVTHNA
jgi:hypothetical protein